MNLIARKLAQLLAENAQDSFYEDEIRYGLEIALGALFQLVIIALIAVILGIAKEVITIAIAAALYRRYSGGAHCQAYYRCTLTSLTSFIILGYLTRYIPPVYDPFYITGTAILSIVIIQFYVPVDNPTNRITDDDIRKKRKQQSYLTVLLIIIASTILSLTNVGEIFSMPLLMGLLWQDFTLLPSGNSYICFLDHIFGKMEKIIQRKVV